MSLRRWSTLYKEYKVINQDWEWNAERIQDLYTASNEDRRHIYENFSAVITSNFVKHNIWQLISYDALCLILFDQIKCCQLKWILWNARTNLTSIFVVIEKNACQPITSPSILLIYSSENSYDRLMHHFFNNLLVLPVPSKSQECMTGPIETTWTSWSIIKLIHPYRFEVFASTKTWSR